MSDGTYRTIQPLLLPEYGVSTEQPLYFRLEDAAVYSDETRDISFLPGGGASFDTAMNMFNAGKWMRDCDLDDLALRLEGEGRFGLVVFEAFYERSWERLVERVVTLEPGKPLRIDLSGFARHEPRCVLFFRLRALEPGRLTDVAWETRQAPLRAPDIMLSITTFKREDAVRATVARFEAYMAKSPIAEHLHLAVVDNGQSAGIEPSAHVTPIANDNLGGSGGFARGLIEAEQRGATHCLFMDDDASIHMEALERAWSFLAYATDDRTALAGGMTMGLHRWALWESGATFNRACKPAFLGTDLRDLGETLEMELESTRKNPANFYGGWWFFAFPVAHARYRPFPFFVRGDDVSFSLANDFNIVTLPGLLCFQDADFSDKESLLTLYLDLRSHLAHHLALPGLDIGRLATLKMAARFFARSLVQCHYESCAALTLAMEDAMRGPAFFAENADMAARRADIAALRVNEAWREGEAPAESRQWWKPKFPPMLWLMLFTLNGHLLPFFGAFGDARVLRGNQRGELHKIWGARQVTYVNANNQIFTARHSKLVALRQTLKFLRVAARFARRYDQVKQDWRGGYVELASDAFWRRRLGLSDPAVPASEAAPLSASN